MTSTATTTEVSIEAEVLSALGRVLDPELDEPITDLGFVRSVAIDDVGVEVHLRLPTSFCSPNFAYLMIADAYDELARVPETGVVRVLLDDHHDSDKINAGTTAGLGYLEIFGSEADQSLEGLRATFQRKAHTAAVERSCRALLAQGRWTLEEIPLLELMDLPEGLEKSALLRRREALGLSNRPHDLVIVDHLGYPIPTEDTALYLRLAMSTRISIEGNSHFCRGLLATRYADSDPAAVAGIAVVTNTRRNA